MQTIRGHIQRKSELAKWLKPYNIIPPMFAEHLRSRALTLGLLPIIVRLVNMAKQVQFILDKNAKP
jgi:hypothetical protein